uniref:Phage protein n=1 Tax=Prevotella sp. GTC17262 TaxID=3236797 RepID=A0AB33JHM5_9BACT
MGRIKGTPKTGGRTKGTPNKVTASLKDFIRNLIDENREQVIADLRELEPYQRLLFIERLIGYVLPKQASVDVQSQIEAEYKALDRLIDEAPDEFIDKITSKILKLQEAKKQ